MAHRLRYAVIAAFALAAVAAQPAGAMVRGKPVPGISMYGEPKYPPDFSHFDYVNPDAPKGGTYVRVNEAYLTFDTLNPFTLKGAAAYGLDLMTDGLATTSLDEPFSVYGLIAESIEVAEDNSWVQFVVRPEAHFSDGSPITAEDVVFTFETLMTKAQPQYRFIYADVDKAEVTAPRTVRFTFKTTKNRELPLVVATLPVLSKAYWENRDFAATSLEVPVTSGPYTVDTFEVSRNIVYRRLDNYWGKNLAANRGLNNFDRIRFEYFRDESVAFEGFKRNAFDFERETDLRKWMTAYNFPAVRDGRVVKLEVPSVEPMVNRMIVLNMRRDRFKDRRVREALNYAFDFESLNKSLFFGLNQRLHSWWQNSELEAKGLPSEAEVKLLEPFRNILPPEVFTTEFKQPVFNGTGDVRDNLLKARALLEEAGWVERDGVLVNAKTGEPFTIEMMIVQASLDEIFLPYVRNLKRLGIEAKLRLVDTSQYANRINAQDYDCFFILQSNGLSPGNEQGEYWSSASADRPGSSNYNGVKDPAVDALAREIVEASDRENVITATRALDRVLKWNYYGLLTYGRPVERFAYWSKLKRPDILPSHGLGFGDATMALWWADPAADKNDAAAKDPESMPRMIGLSAFLLIVIGAVFLAWRSARPERS